MEKHVVLDHVSVTFDTPRGRFVALQDITLAIGRGEFLSLIGHSGCGKSTLLNVIAGLVMPTSGAALCSGREIPGPGPDRAVVFQNHSLLPWLTAFAKRVPGGTQGVRRPGDEGKAASAHRRRYRPGGACPCA
jgi:nitrate/nitrite transport system ATP-binding protein